jgi:hypothetical protein
VQYTLYTIHSTYYIVHSTHNPLYTVLCTQYLRPCVMTLRSFRSLRPHFETRSILSQRTLTPARTQACTHTHTHICKHVHTYTHARAHVHTRARAHVHTHALYSDRMFVLLRAWRVTLRTQRTLCYGNRSINNP